MENLINHLCNYQFKNPFKLIRFGLKKLDSQYKRLYDNKKLDKYCLYDQDSAFSCRDIFKFMNVGNNIKSPSGKRIRDIEECGFTNYAEICVKVFIHFWKLVLYDVMKGDIVHLNVSDNKLFYISQTVMDDKELKVLRKKGYLSEFDLLESGFRFPKVSVFMEKNNGNVKKLDVVLGKKQIVDNFNQFIKNGKTNNRYF